MKPTTLFYILITILIINFIIDKILNSLNSKHFNDENDFSIKQRKHLCKMQTNIIKKILPK